DRGARAAGRHGGWWPVDAAGGAAARVDQRGVRPGAGDRARHGASLPARRRQLHVGRLGARCGGRGGGQGARVSGDLVPIEARGLTKTFGERTALAGVDVTVRQGDVSGYLGRNGAGKTTSLRMMLGLIRPT